jgi:hypothetical protein
MACPFFRIWPVPLLENSLYLFMDLVAKKMWPVPQYGLSLFSKKMWPVPLLVYQKQMKLAQDQIDELLAKAEDADSTPLQDCKKMWPVPLLENSLYLFMDLVMWVYENEERATVDSRS